MGSFKNFFSGFGASDLMNLAGGLFGAVGNIISTDMTNKNNAKLQEQANAAQAAESEKAYNRSKATNQVALMQQAGMSRAGALNALNGGGSYTPAPVNASQEQAPQVDMSFLSSIASNVAQTQRFEKELGLEKQKFEFEKKKQEFAEKMEQERNERENAANAREEYEKSLKMLTIDMQNKAVSIERLVNPTEFDSPAAYRAALYEKCDDEQKKCFDNANFVATLNLHHAAEVAAKNTAANTRSVLSSTKIAERAAVLDNMLKKSTLYRQELENDLLENKFSRDDEIWKFTQQEMAHKVQMWVYELSKAKSDSEISKVRSDIESALKDSNIDLQKLRNELESFKTRNSQEVFETNDFIGALWFLSNQIGLPIKLS